MATSRGPGAGHTDRYLAHAKPDAILADLGLDRDGIMASALSLLAGDRPARGLARQAVGVTPEPELTEPVDLCTPDGTTLNPEARGWARRPLHRANLDGVWGRNKRWDYWAVLAGDLVVSCVYSDIDHLGRADVYWADLVSGESGGLGIIVEAGVLSLPERPATAPLRIDREGLDLSLLDDPDGTTHLQAAWTEPDGRPGRFDLAVELPGARVAQRGDPVERRRLQLHLEALGPTDDRRAGGRRSAVGGRRSSRRSLGRARRRPGTVAPRDLLELGRRRGRSGEHVIGLQIGGKWTEGTGFTENGLIVDGRLTKLGQELTWGRLGRSPAAVADRGSGRGSCRRC